MLTILALLTSFPPAAFAAPPPGLELLARTDPTALELAGISVKLIPSNLRALDENIRLLDGAVGEATAVTFDWRADMAGRAVAYAAIRAARRGVRVRIVVDGLHGSTPSERRLEETMVREGVEVALFRPPRQDMTKVVERLHEKSLFAGLPDGGARVIMGGRNKSDHYFLGRDVFDLDLELTLSREQARAFHRRQFDPLLRSRAVVRLGASKGSSWKHEVELARIARAYGDAREILRAQLGSEPQMPEVRVGWALLSRNRPGRPAATRLITTAIRDAREGILVANAYVVPTTRLQDALSGKLDAGVKISLFTNSRATNAHPSIYRLMSEPISRLVPRGLSLFLRREGEIHAKAMAVDGRLFVVGSANLDPRSELYDTQNVLLLDSPELSRQLDRLLAAQLTKGEYAAVGRDGLLADGSRRAFSASDGCTRILLEPLARFF